MSNKSPMAGMFLVGVVVILQGVRQVVATALAEGLGQLRSGALDAA
jgi:hypothetical protein